MKPKPDLLSLVLVWSKQILDFLEKASLFLLKLQNPRTLYAKSVFTTFGCELPIIETSIVSLPQLNHSNSAANSDKGIAFSLEIEPRISYNRIGNHRINGMLDKRIFGWFEREVRQVGYKIQRPRRLIYIEQREGGEGGEGER